MTQHDEIKSLRLIAYEPLGDHGLCLPCYGSAYGANTYFHAVCSIKGKRDGIISHFVEAKFNSRVLLPRHLVREVSRGETWIDVFIWEKEIFCGNAAEIWKALAPYRAAIAEKAPLSFLEVCEKVQGDDVPKTGVASRSAVNWLKKLYGAERAASWRDDSYLRGKLTQAFREIPNIDLQEPNFRAMLKLIRVKTSEDKVTVFIPNTFDLILKEQGQNPVSGIIEETLALGLQWAGVELISLPSPPSVVFDKEFKHNLAKEIIVSGHELPEHWKNRLHSLRLGKSGIRDFTGLKGLTNLHTLTAPGTVLDNKSASTISKLEKLRVLNIDSTWVTNISFLKDLTSLVDLDVSNNKIVDATAIKNLEKLVTLRIQNTNIRDIEFVSSLKNLNYLNVSYTKISDVSILGKLEKLRFLLLQYTAISDLKFAQDLKSLRWLHAGATEINDIRPIAKCTRIQHLYLNKTKLTDLTGIGELHELQHLSLSESTVSDISSIVDLATLNYLDLEKTTITSLPTMSGLKRLSFLGLGSTGISSLKELENLERLSVLSVDRTNINSIRPLSRARRLKYLDISFTDVADLSPLRNNQTLETLHINHTKVSDFSVLRSLPKLSHLIIGPDDSFNKNDLPNLKRVTKIP